MEEVQVIRRRGRPPKMDSQEHVEASSFRRKVAHVRLHIAQQLGTSVSQTWDSKKHKVEMYEHPHGIEVVVPKSIHLDQEYPAKKHIILTTSNIQSYVLEAEY